MKGPGNTNGIATTTGDGRHRAKASLQPQPLVTAPKHHTMDVLAVMRPARLAKDSAFPCQP